MENLTFEALRTAATVILLIFGAIVTIGKGVEVIKKWRNPQMQKDNAQTADIKKCMDKLDNDKRRLDKHARDIEDLREGQKYLCMGVQALLGHELHNGNADEMKAASAGIKSWLLNRT